MYYVLYSVLLERLGDLSFSCLTITAYFPGFKVVYRGTEADEV